MRKSKHKKKYSRRHVMRDVVGDGWSLHVEEIEGDLSEFLRDLKAGRV